jgi:RHS repeat-associated protein
MNFKVDGLGFRRFKEVVGQYQRWFVYDLGASEVPGLAPLVAEYDESGNLVAKYHYDGGGLIAMTRNNQSYWYGFEGIGTTRQLMGSQGQVVDAYAFDAWGNELTNPQSQVQNPFKYVGKHGYYLDTESALMLLGVRYYSAEIGRFWSLDTIKSELNWYLYTNNKPTIMIDPTGKIADIIGGMIGGCAVQAILGGIGGYLRGGSTCEVGCAASAGCIMGAIQGLIATTVFKFAPWEAWCMYSAISSIVSPLLNDLCKALFCPRPCISSTPTKPSCGPVKGIINTFANCLGKYLAEDWAENIIDKLFTYLSRGLSLGCDAWAGFEKKFLILIR